MSSPGGDKNVVRCSRVAATFAAIRSRHGARLLVASSQCNCQDIPRSLSLSRDEFSDEPRRREPVQYTSNGAEMALRHCNHLDQRSVDEAIALVRSCRYEPSMDSKRNRYSGSDIEPESVILVSLKQSVPSENSRPEK